MKFLKWYSTIILSLSLISLVIQVLFGNAVDPSSDVWGIILFVPILLYFILTLKKDAKYGQV